MGYPKRLTVMNREIIFDISRWICLFIAWACAADMVASLSKWGVWSFKSRFDYILAAEFMAWLWTSAIIVASFVPKIQNIFGQKIGDKFTITRIVSVFLLILEF